MWRREIYYARDQTEWKKKVLFRPASHSTCVADQEADTAGYKIAELGKRGRGIGGILRAVAGDDQHQKRGYADHSHDQHLLTEALIR